MRTDEILRALSLLPPPLHERASVLRTFLRPTRCDGCERIGDALRLALTAAHYDEFTSAGHLLDTAEHLAADHAHQRGPACRPHRDDRRGRGQVRRWAGTSAPLVAATDASWKGRAGGIGYVVSDGRYGLRSRGTGRLDPTGASRVLVDELRAVDFLFSAYDEVPARMTVLLDSRSALRYLHRWQAGETAAMPAGYSLRPRTSAAQPTLVRLAGLAGSRPDLTFDHVKGHDGHALNEAADGLAHMARRRVTETFDVRPRAHSLAEAFLNDWHAALAH
ncbi:ribonuclease HI [Micromonospora siamensis]|uniref:Ribonuclease HI n=1 Tax=Micromonospora siamensis TaxID=299152 RepID=A0A1C5J358_9ACTN|nr:RNase H family protein [Micromonospora siamensis]SCG65020.1 Ribonuclease HI [Micromonospora siamensis]